MSAFITDPTRATSVPHVLAEVDGVQQVLAGVFGELLHDGFDLVFPVFFRTQIFAELQGQRCCRSCFAVIVFRFEVHHQNRLERTCAATLQIFHHAIEHTLFEGHHHVEIDVGTVLPSLRRSLDRRIPFQHRQQPRLRVQLLVLLHQILAHRLVRRAERIHVRLLRAPGSFTCCPTPKDSTSNPWSRSAACASMLRFWFDAQTMANRIATDVHARLRRSCEPDEA
eukprot:CAMPEP_0113928070 /NCGR_PEP_ID=MMETSP1159-20121227/4630_1 /TAXON_ID=88271 /ORGANISM="Picocystis salinarum" /LENGTH=224 /DNA_ID=CAMNT_0000928581 /DNA_START=28 /DNA_END=702 /DNA_ORIENTATION=- /assembly_acc=CAM_ASM_000767